MTVMNKKLIILKLIFIIAALVVVHFEVGAYTNTRTSFAEMIMYRYHENILIIGYLLISVTGVALILNKSKPGNIFFALLICVYLILFYPLIDLEGIDNPF